jgi:hypothetical protein
MTHHFWKIEIGIGLTYFINIRSSDQDSKKLDFYDEIVEKGKLANLKDTQSIHSNAQTLIYSIKLRSETI